MIIIVIIIMLIIIIPICDYNNENNSSNSNNGNIPGSCLLISSLTENVFLMIIKLLHDRT